MKVNFSLEMKPNEFIELIESMGMSQVVDKLVTPSMLGAFMKQATRESDSESNPWTVADDARDVAGKASDDAEAAKKTVMNNADKIHVDSEAESASGCDCDRDAVDRGEDPTDDEPAYDGPCMSTVKIHYPDTGKNVTITKAFDPATGERISCRTDTQFPDGKTIMEEEVYA